ncbi:MAG: septum site-determining protein MinC [Cyanobacteria bacterium P01_H01_bin.15]
MRPLSQIQLKTQGDHLLVTLPSENLVSEPLDWEQLSEELETRLQQGSWGSGTPVILQVHDRLLGGHQLQTLLGIFQRAGRFQLKKVLTTRRQTAVAAATNGYSVEQTTPNPLAAEDETLPFLLAEPLYFSGTLRSGKEIAHPGNVILIGDLNPGGAIIAAGDILVWGFLRGVVHAGAWGDRARRIMALKMLPTQLRIADIVARAPTRPPNQWFPEIAYAVDDGIRISRAEGLNRP